MYSVKNLGIPCYSPLYLKLFDLTLSCAKNKSSLIDRERLFRNEVRSRYTSLMSTSSLGRYKDILSGIDFVCNDNSYGTFDVSHATLLKDSFHYIGSDVLDRLNYLCDINTRNSFYSTDDIDLIKKDFYLLFCNRPSKVPLKHFITNEIDYYRDLYSCISNNNLDLSDLVSYYEDGLDCDKLGLYLSFIYLDKVLSLIDKDKVLAQKYLFYVTGYINSDLNKNTKIFYNNKEYSYDLLKEKYKLIISNSTIKSLLVDRDLFFNKDKSSNENVIDSLISMDKLYTYESFVKESIGNNSNSGNTKKESTPITEEELNFIRKYINERYYTYLKNNPVARIDCVNYFNNYVGFLFSNGIIVADRLKNVKRTSECNSDAIYLFDIFNFDELIKLDKLELRGIVKRIIHNDGWEGKVYNEVNDGSLADKTLIKSFISHHL